GWFSLLRGTSVQLRVAEVVQRRVQGGRDSDMWLRGVIFKRANSPPRITARRGGGVPKKTARSRLIDAAGGVFLVPSIGTPPRPFLRLRAGAFALRGEKRMLARYFLDRSATPPRGDARRGVRHLENGA